MSALAAHAADYLTLRRALGVKLIRQGQELTQLVAFCDAAGASTLTADLAIAWARLPQDVAPTHWANRLATARGFARYVTSLDPATEVPPPNVFPHSERRRDPYLFTDDDIDQLLRAAAGLRPPLRAATYTTVLGLLTATGMRVGEALRLKTEDIDHTASVLTVTEAKLDRPRMIPLHPTTNAALASYADMRRSIYPKPAAFFVSSLGRPLAYSTLKKTFNQLATATGLRTPASRPHMHDLRHRFAVRVLVDAYRTGADVPARMAVLSTYLGHGDPADTYWYLSAVPELMELAATRLASCPVVGA